MASSAPQSAGRRFLGKFGFALVQAAIVGCLLGAPAYFRTPRIPDDEESAAPWKLRDRLEAFELLLYDWRARELGDVSKPSDDVVVVAVNDETLTEARESSRQGVAMQPWPRELVGGLVQELLREGASLVVVDALFPDLSPRACASLLPGEALDATNEALLLDDDWRFRARLDRAGGKAILAFSWANSFVPPAPPPLTPFGLLVGRPKALDEQWPLVQTILSDRKRLFRVPEGDRIQLWAGGNSAEECSDLARLWQLKGTPEIRALTSADTEHPVTPVEMLLALSEVHVDGIDRAKLFQVDRLTPPVPALLGEKSHYGSVSVDYDVDGLVRGFPHLVGFRYKNEIRVLPSAPLSAAMALAGDRHLRYRDGHLEIGGKYRVPMGEDGVSLIRWDQSHAHQSGGSINHVIPAWNVIVNLEDSVDGRPLHSPNRDLKGHVAILTNTSTTATDWKPTPIGGHTPGGAIQAQALANIIRSEGISRVGPNVDFALVLALAFLGAILALAFSGALKTSSGAILYSFSLAMAIGVYAVAARYVFIHQRLWVAMGYPLIALVSTFLLSTIYALRSERRVKEFIHTVLGRYVSPEVARQVTNDLSLMRPERRVVTVLFSDIEGFTALSEKLPAERLAQLLTEYFSVMTAVIRHHDGQIDKYIGDAIMAFWGAPIRTDRHAQLACESAIEMRTALFEKQADWERRFDHRLRFRVGINTGEVVVGDMGSDLKSNYTVMGDAVNLASRLEGANKAFGTSILVGGQTVERVGPEIVFREIDRVRVKGRTEPTRVYELMGRANEVPPGRAKQIEPFARALDAFHRQRFNEALSQFERSAALEDPVAAAYVKRCRDYLVTPPPPDWDGVYDLKEK